jgi:hypothetical protein
MWFSYEGNTQTFVQLTVDRVKQIIDWNKQGIQPEELAEEVKIKAPAQPLKHPDFEPVASGHNQRFDKKKQQQGGNNQGNNPNRRRNNNHHNQKRRDAK